MAAYRRVYDSRRLQADCQEPGSAPEPYEYRLPLPFSVFGRLSDVDASARGWVYAGALQQARRAGRRVATARRSDDVVATQSLPADIPQFRRVVRRRGSAPASVHRPPPQAPPSRGAADASAGRWSPVGDRDDCTEL